MVYRLSYGLHQNLDAQADDENLAFADATDGCNGFAKRQRALLADQSVETIDVET